MTPMKVFLCNGCGFEYEAQYPMHGTDRDGLVLWEILCGTCADEREQEFERDRFDSEMEKRNA